MKSFLPVGACLTRIGSVWPGAGQPGAFGGQGMQQSFQFARDCSERRPGVLGELSLTPGFPAWGAKSRSSANNLEGVPRWGGFVLADIDPKMEPYGRAARTRGRSFCAPGWGSPCGVNAFLDRRKMRGCGLPGGTWGYGGDFDVAEAILASPRQATVLCRNRRPCRPDWENQAEYVTRPGLAAPKTGSDQRAGDGIPAAQTQQINRQG